jgi:hypothetical protein
MTCNAKKLAMLLLLALLVMSANAVDLRIFISTPDLGPGEKINLYVDGQFYQTFEVKNWHTPGSTDEPTITVSGVEKGTYKLTFELEGESRYENIEKEIAVQGGFPTNAYVDWKPIESHAFVSFILDELPDADDFINYLKKPRKTHATAPLMGNNKTQYQTTVPLDTLNYVYPTVDIERIYPNLSQAALYDDSKYQEWQKQVKANVAKIPAKDCGEGFPKEFEVYIPCANLLYSLTDYIDYKIDIWGHTARVYFEDYISQQGLGKQKLMLHRGINRIHYGMSYDPANGYFVTSIRRIDNE